MTESGDPKDNSQAEHINNTMKNELLKGMKFCCIQEVQQDIDKAVNLYNKPQAEYEYKHDGSCPDRTMWQRN